MVGIKDLGNYYGGLNVQEKDGKYYWIIENYDTDFSDINEWHEISKVLYLELLNHNKPGAIRSINTSLPAEVAEKILKARDAFVADDMHEVWHQLYSIASPNFDQLKPWNELEQIVEQNNKD